MQKESLAWVSITSLPLAFAIAPSYDQVTEKNSPQALLVSLRAK